MAKQEKEKKESAFEGIIKKYLDMMAEQDPLFAETYKKPNKSIAECCKYIKQEAQKLKDGTVAIVEDATVYGWAVHYYDEDDIKIESAPAAKVATPAKPIAAPTSSVKAEPKKPKVGDQLSLFDFM